MAAEWSLALTDRLAGQPVQEMATEQAGSPPATNEYGQALRDESGSSPAARSEPGIWELVKKHLNLAESRPQVHPAVIARELTDRRGSYHVLKNTQEKTYLRLSPAEHRLFSQMDGRTSVEELIVAHYIATGAFAHNVVVRLVDQLYRQHMLVDPPVAVWSQLNRAIQKRSWLDRISSPAQLFLTQRLAIKKLDTVVDWIYKHGGRLLFTRIAGVFFLLVSVIGLVAFSLVLQDPQHVFLGENLVPGLALLWGISILPVLVHEFGHALTVKHFGREVPKGGLMLFFGLPAAFVETTDIWLEPRRARLAVTWNGPYTGLILGGAAALVMYFFPSGPLNSLLFKMAGFAYLTVFLNVNPLLKLDGYYLLSDALEIPMLRERSMAFVRHKLPGKLGNRKKLSREEWIFTVFGLLSIVWSVYALYLAYFFWQTRIRSGLQTLLGSGYSLVARFFSLILLVALLSFAALLLLSLFRLVQSLVARFLQSGVLARHGWLALVGAALAAAIGIGLPVAFPGQAYWLYSLISFVAAGVVALKLLGFTRPYLGSPRGLAFLAFAAALGFNSLAHLSRLLPAFAAPAANLETLSLLAALAANLETLSLLALIAGGLLLVWPPLVRTGPARLLAGGLAGVAWLVFFSLTSGLPYTDDRSLAFSALVTVAVWVGASLWGSARLPAFILLYLGGVAPALNWLVRFPAGDLRLVGALLLAAGGLHLLYARLPTLSVQRVGESAARTHAAIGAAASVLVRRLISQVFFESGERGVRLIGQAFSNSMGRAGEDLSIWGNQFLDPQLPERAVDELTEVYGLAFDELHRLVCAELGRGMGTLAFGYGIDLLSWQDREVVTELILSRRSWGLSLKQKVVDSKANRLKILRRVPLFVDLSPLELDRVARSLKTERFSAGETVIRQDEPGDKFYIVERGNVTVWKTGPDGVEEKQAKLGPGQYFGEMALVTHAPRNAAVRAETPVQLLSLDQGDFDRLVSQYVSLAEQVNTNVRHSWLLRGMPIFDELGSQALDLLAARLQPETFKAGEVVFREGEAGDRFYIIESGQLLVTQSVNGQEVEISRRRPGEYVGEIALLQNRPRTATIAAAVDSTLLGLQAEHFHELVSGHLQLGQALSRAGTRRLASVVAG
jgi:putative peptide zinc metalloprotease protein